MSKAKPRTKKRPVEPRSAGKAGRRPGTTSTREEILDAAEETFAASGYAGTSLRQISKKAQVNQALLHHYFGSKEGLFKGIFLRRGQQLSRERLELLDLLEQRSGTPPSLEEIVRAYLIPAFNMKRRGAGGIAFLKLQAQLLAEPAANSRELRAEVYEKMMHRYVAALNRALPSLDPKAVFWRLMFMVGAFNYTIAYSHHLDALSGGLCNSQDHEEAFAHIVPFLVRGLGAPFSTNSGNLSLEGKREGRIKAPLRTSS
jgi:AcrR family transcriptional regulator